MGGRGVTQALLVLVTLSVCSCFHAPLGPVGALNARRGMVASCRRVSAAPLGLRMADKTPPEGGKEGEDTVEISVEELQALASKAGIRVQVGSTPQRGRPPRNQAPAEPEVNNFEPLLKALEPVFALPPILQYPVLLGIFGAVSAIFLPLFGSATLGDMTGNKPSSEQVTAEKAPEKEKKPAFEFKATAPPPEEMNIQKSCDIFPWKYTPTCTDPNIGEKGLLKNLDQYTKPNEKVQKMRAESEAKRAAAEAANKEKAAAEAK